MTLSSPGRVGSTRTRHGPDFFVKGHREHCEESTVFEQVPPFFFEESLLDAQVAAENGLNGYFNYSKGPFMLCTLRSNNF